jgi:hypothetical protein
VISQIPTEGLVGYYLLNGDAKDNLGSSTTGVINGAVAIQNRFNKVQSALYFDGSANVDFNMVFDNSNRTVSIWFKRQNTTNKIMTLVSNDIPGLNYGHSIITLDNSNNLNVLSGTSSCLNNFQTEINKWYHVLLTRDNTTTSTFINGEFYCSVPNSTLVSDNAQVYAFRLGVNRRSENYFNGSLDDLLLWNRALTENEIKRVYFDGVCKFYDQEIVSKYNVSSQDFKTISPKKYLEKIDSLKTRYGDCDSIINKYSEFVFEPNYFTDTLKIYDTTYYSVSDTLIIDVSLTGIPSEIIINRIKVFPNPTNSYLTIEFGDYNLMENYLMKIENIQGQLIYQTKIDKSEITIDFNNFGSTGTNILSIIDPNNKIVISKKIILY